MGENFQQLVQWLGNYGYPVLFVLVFAESTGLPLPGETAVLAAAVLASRPDSPLSIGWVIVVVILAAVLGDNLGFWVGDRWARPRLRAGRSFLFLTPQALQTVEGYFQHYGSLTVAVSRFVAGLRVVAALAAGTSGMHWTRFLVANLIGAVAWSVVMSLLGYYFGQSWELLHHWMGRGALILAGSAVVIVGLPYLLRRIRELPLATGEHFLRARLWDGFVAAVLVVVCVAILVLQAEHAARPQSETDSAVRKWVEAHTGATLDAAALAASYLGSLPAIAVVALGLLAASRHAGRPWQEQAVVIWALAGSEAVGLVLLALIRHKGIQPELSQAWPFGFAGLATLRAAAVFGVMAQMSRKLKRARALAVSTIAACAIGLTGFSAVWARKQRLTEVVVEVAAGALVLFVGQWLLEGYGAGPLPVPLTATDAGADEPAPPQA